MRCDNREERVLASNALAREATMERSRYWQAMCWRKRRQWRGAGIGKQCAGARGDYREERVLSSNVLVQDATIESIGKQCAGARGDNGGEWVLAIASGKGSETCSDVKWRTGAAEHEDTCNKTCANSF
ncbi:hypothetical protein BD769DRAFT_1389148 [Suillus cothurnatus]|nr:hypothetical protein BD769DRAFT_1389148 [Suillus cothurnatus]